MKRLHLFELMDQAWWPDRFKKMETDYLGAANRLIGFYRPAVSTLGRAMRHVGCRRIVDLCSGSGTHLEPILAQIEAEQKMVCGATLTDIAPHADTYTEIGRRNARFGHVNTPVDARDVPGHLHGFRTLFAGFHHFSPDHARRILKNAFETGTGIAVVEHTRRSPFGILSMLFTPILVWALTPFIRPFRFSRLFWTYVVPVVPFAILWDGIVSAFRSYTEPELRAMVAPLASPDYQWGFETFRVGGLVATTLLIGYPAASRIVEQDATEKAAETRPAFAMEPSFTRQRLPHAT